MTSSAAKCREQEALHRTMAADAVLPNIKNVALAAAEAWHRQAQEAEVDENGTRPLLSKEDAAIALEFLLEDDADLADGWTEEDGNCRPPLSDTENKRF